MARAKHTAKLWGGRFSRGLLPELERFSSSLEIDFELYPYDIAGSIAHARGLAAAGLLTPPRLLAIERGLRRIKKELDAGTFQFAPTDEDIHTAIERRLTEITPAGASLHAGRSRNDQVALDLRLYCRAAASEAIAGVAKLVAALAASAASHASWVMPGYTHLQRAQPVTVGHHLLAHAEPLLRDAERFSRAYQSADVMPLGSGALAGSTLPLRREWAAKELGFSRLTANSIDAVADRDFALDLTYACASASLHLSRLGEDVVLWASSEFGFVKLVDEIATGSSLMPQKKNPDIAELLRGRAGRALGSLTALGTVLKGLPLAYDRDLQEDKPALFAAVDNALDSIRAAELLVRHLEFDRERLATAASDPGLVATDAAEDLVRAGVPFRRAHEAIGRQVRDGAFQPPSEAATSLRRRDLPGAPHPRRVSARAAEVRREAARLLRWSQVHPPGLPT
ncbi:MAG TPA: argininosuccinate lyase [Candidatus Dormibacteraeota bacterium]|nr:argininosuccinate lyase [Candidatus Dormibacteraeota bacterium]